MNFATLVCVKSDAESAENKGVAARALRAYVARFWSHVDKVNGPIHPTLGRCWDWTAFCHPKTGYGCFTNALAVIPGTTRPYAHRVSFFLEHGAFPPKGMHVRHQCHRRRCVRPLHLLDGTPKENAQDSIRDGNYRIGQVHPSAKLTEADVALIRALRAGGQPVAALGDRFGVAGGTISTICAGLKWAHVGGPRTVSRRNARIREMAQ